MNAQAIAERVETSALDVPQAPVSSLTPQQMIYQLIAAGTDIEAVRDMMALSKELAADQARRAFDTAVADAKAEIKPILKKRDGHTGKYADMAAYAAGIDEILGRHGLSYRHTVPAQTDKTITVACKLSHRDGHSEVTPLTAPFDTTGSKNAIQSMGSSLTYLQRYTLVLALGLAAAVDDNGVAAGKQGNAGPISAQQADDLRKLMDEVNADIVKFCAYMKVDALVDIPAPQYQRAVAALEAKRVRS